MLKDDEWNIPWNESKSFLRRVEADPLGPFANVLRLITSGLPLPLREGLFPSKTEVLSFQLILFGEEMGKTECLRYKSSEPHDANAPLLGVTVFVLMVRPLGHWSMGAVILQGSMTKEC